MMRIISHSVTCLIVISLLNGCFFQTQADKTWPLAPEGSTSLALSRDARFALLYSKQQHLQLWDLEQNTLLAKLGIQDPEQNIISLMRFSDNARFAITRLKPTSPFGISHGHNPKDYGPFPMG